MFGGCYLHYCVCVFVSVFTHLCVCVWLEGEYSPWESERRSGVWLDEEEAGVIKGSPALRR